MNEIIANFKKIIKDSLENTENHSLPPEILELEGMSGKKFRLFINKLLSSKHLTNYLEIGVWKGSTSISALYGNTNKINYTLIDNFSQFEGKQDFFDNWTRFFSEKPMLLDENCFEIYPKKMGIKDVDVYFYDGAHEEIDQYKALHHYYHSFANCFIYIVDDWCWEEVIRGTETAIEELNLIVHEKIELLPENYSKPTYMREKHYSDTEWWNGYCVFLFEKG